MIIFILFVIILIVVLVVLFKFKKLPLDSVVMVNGSVGSGKTSTCVNIAIRSHKKNVRIYKIRKFLHLKVENEEPLLYSNIPLFKVKYVPITKDMILRNVRPNFKSILLISESSIVANSQSNKNKYVNDRLTLWLKLIRHELHGTYAKVPNLIVETQSINDNHYSFDRCITQSLYITKKVNIPFFRLVKARELLLFDSVVNNMDDDLENCKMRWYLIPKRVFKLYDSYAYSVLTDNLPKYNKIVFYPYKKKVVFEIPTLLNYKELNEYNKQFGITSNDIVVSDESDGVENE